MTQKIGAYDYTKMHLVHRKDGFIEMYERRLRLIVTNSVGKPKRIIPEGIGYDSFHRFKDKGDRIVKGYVLIPVNLQEIHPEHIK